ncbi:flagellar basal body-associated FliL family protein [Roseovarius sp. LXJ103]|uniref:flagellar basal body-associated FliL family protein n=1 Tax=Roseovarius carneus TaxID=2853164 RepID=UPI000D61ED14|nr:flagellar basal body-associated FliL family protein [Roseovarius carneus]MBZ8117551.1 flagellar basal body-associated FliL family protein [Roseovarius carneus]PWE36655.1 flagellar basal body protein FliL [Pelagicola sp. LXJ1103]
MADTEQAGAEVLEKPSKTPLLLGLLLAVAGGGGGFFAVQSGMIFGAESDAASVEVPPDTIAQIGEMPDVAYVPVEPLVVTLGSGATRSHLRFRAQLEVVPAYQAEVETLMPRVVDVLNSYLRALETSDLSDSAALVRLRAQMLRRVQIVTGGERVNDLLIMEFVLN